jgi:hypothetical protein
MRLSVVSLFVPLFDPAAQGQSRDSLRCDDVLETCGHYIYD